MPQAGRYRFEGTEQLGAKKPKPARWNVRQEFTCGKAPLAMTQAPTPAVDPSWQPTPAIEQAVLDATNRYFGLIDAGDGTQAHAAWSLANQQMVPLTQRQASLISDRRAAGEPLGHRVLKLTWYINPEGADVPGIYVAADYEKRYRNLAASCGYLLWYRQPSGYFVIVREESGRLTKAQAAKMSASVLAEARMQLRCPAA